MSFIKGTSKNSNFFVRARKHRRAQNRSVYGIHEDSSTGLTRLSRTSVPLEGEKCIFRGALKRLLMLIVLNTLIVFSQAVQADNMMMARTIQTFPEAMAELQDLIQSKGYVISRVQRIDIGLTNSGYKTDKYRVVFYGKPDEIRKLSQRYPELTAYLPLKISIFAEDQNTILVSANPQHLSKAGDKVLARAIQQWEKDLVDIFRQMREAE